jgi:hypothetical protein
MLYLGKERPQKPEEYDCNVYDRLTISITSNPRLTEVIKT